MFTVFINSWIFSLFLFFFLLGLLCFLGSSQFLRCKGLLCGGGKSSRFVGFLCVYNWLWFTECVLLWGGLGSLLGIYLSLSLGFGLCLNLSLLFCSQSRLLFSLSGSFGGWGFSNWLFNNFRCFLCFLNWNLLLCFFRSFNRCCFGSCLLSISLCLGFCLYLSQLFRSELLFSCGISSLSGGTISWSSFFSGLFRSSSLNIFSLGRFFFWYTSLKCLNVNFGINTFRFSDLSQIQRLSLLEFVSKDTRWWRFLHLGNLLLLPIEHHRI